MQTTVLNPHQIPRDATSDVFITDSRLVNPTTLGFAHDEPETYTTHIAFDGSPTDAQKLLDTHMRSYVDGNCCPQEHTCREAEVVYVVDGNEIEGPTQYVCDSSHYTHCTATFMAYCGGSAREPFKLIQTELLAGGASFIAVEPNMVFKQGYVVYLIAPD